MMYWIGGGLAALVAAWKLLVRITAQGGRRQGDATEMAGGVIDEMAAFRGDDPDDREPWDGESRLKIKPNIFGV